MSVTEDMRADRDYLLDAHARTVGHDRQTAWSDLTDSGWSDVFARISGTWTQFDDNGRPCNRMPFRNQRALLQTVGVFKAAKVLAALELWVASRDGGRQPSPADLFQLIAGPGDRDGQTNQPPKLRPDQQPEVLSFVASLIARGELVCECHPAPANLVIDDRGVLWCPDCSGIEVGQADAAREHVDPSPEPDVAIHDLSAVLRLKKVRSLRKGGVRL